MVAFYRDALGFQVSDRGLIGPNGPEVVFMSGSASDHHQIAFAPVRGPEDASSLEHNAFRVDSLADVKETFERMTADPRAKNVTPVTHGNAISVYFSDPEGNAIEVFCDTPWHVQQPQLKPWDPTRPDAEVLAAVEAAFRDEPEFMPMERYRAERAKAFGEG
jgi:catechol-2,3-dioxygenase